MANVKLRITGMTCGHCQAKVEKALKSVTGVYSAVMDLPSGGVDVDSLDTLTLMKRAQMKNFTILLASLALLGSACGKSTTSPIVPNNPSNPNGLGPAALNLGTAGSYVILAKSGVSTTGVTAVVGDIGISPAPAANVTGFA